MEVLGLDQVLVVVAEMLLKLEQEFALVSFGRLRRRYVHFCV